MSQTNTFPQNILDALDALAELGKITQDKAQIPSPINAQTVVEKTKDPKPKKAVKKNKIN